MVCRGTLKIKINKKERHYLTILSKFHDLLSYSMLTINIYLHFITKVISFFFSNKNIRHIFEPFFIFVNLFRDIARLNLKVLIKEIKE